MKLIALNCRNKCDQKSCLNKSKFFSELALFKYGKKKQFSEYFSIRF